MDTDQLRERWSKARQEPHAIQRFLARKGFGLFERAGFHVVGDHFYEPVPNSRDISASHVDEPRACRGIDFRFEQAERLAVDVVERWGPAFFDSATRHGYREVNSYYRGLDAVMLYGLVRERQPRTVVEVGQGMSTRVLLAALEDNHRSAGGDAELVTIDPFVRGAPQDAPDGVQMRRVQQPVQAIVGTALEELLACDLLLVDSSHVHKFGSDVAHQFDHVYPSVAVGTLVHVHDIFTPFPYPRDWYLQRRRFWNEAEHLENFLRFNDRFEVTLPLQYLIRESGAFRRAWEGTCTHPQFKPKGYAFYFTRVS